MARHIRFAAVAAALLVGISPAAIAKTTSAPPRYLETPAGQKPRVVITADPELDDSNSLVRYLLYSTDYRTEGLIYTSSQFHWSGDGKGTKLSVPGREYTRFGPNPCPCTSWRWNPKERFIDDAVERYAKAYPNLRVHNSAYPTPGALKAKIRWGNVQFDGEMAHDTDGSNLIKSLLLDNEESPVYLHAWGGQSTIARALKSIEEQYKGTPRWAEIRAKVVRKAVIHPSGDQDDTYAKYIAPNWPDIRYRQQASGVLLSYNAQNMVSEADSAYYTAAWMHENVSSRGPLGEFERVWGDGKQMVKGDKFDFFGVADTSAEDLRKQGYVVWTKPLGKGEFLGEGDTGTFLNLIDNGLGGYRGATFGGWGGYARHGAVPPGMGGFELSFGGGGGITRMATHPFLAAVQNDWAARFKWAVTPTYAGANHNPKIAIVGSSMITAKSGAKLTLAAKTSDPDGDTVAVRWWNWQKAGSYAGDVPVEGSGDTAIVTVPADAKSGDTFQIIAEATDSGTPALTHYGKVVVTVAP